MPPKKNPAAADAGEAIVGFSARDTKLIAAAFVASTGPDKVSCKHQYLGKATDTTSMTTTCSPL